MYQQRKVFSIKTIRGAQGNKSNLLNCMAHIYIWIKYAARNLRCMGYTLKTKSHKGQESRTRSQGPGAIDHEPRTKSQAYMHAWSQTKRLRPACRRLRCTNIYAIFSIHSIGDKSKSAVSLRQRRSAGHADNPRALLPKVTRAAWPKWKLP